MQIAAWFVHFLFCFVLLIYRFWPNLFDSQKWWRRRPKNIRNENHQTRIGSFSERTASNLLQWAGRKYFAINSSELRLDCCCCALLLLLLLLFILLLLRLSFFSLLNRYSNWCMTLHFFYNWNMHSKRNRTITLWWITFPMVIFMNFWTVTHWHCNRQKYAVQKLYAQSHIYTNIKLFIVI